MSATTARPSSMRRSRCRDNSQRAASACWLRWRLLPLPCGRSSCLTRDFSYCSPTLSPIGPSFRSSIERFRATRSCCCHSWRFSRRPRPSASRVVAAKPESWSLPHFSRRLLTRRSTSRRAPAARPRRRMRLHGPRRSFQREAACSRTNSRRAWIRSDFASIVYASKRSVSSATTTTCFIRATRLD